MKTIRNTDPSRGSKSCEGYSLRRALRLGATAVVSAAGLTLGAAIGPAATVPVDALDTASTTALSATAVEGVVNMADLHAQLVRSTEAHTVALEAEAIAGAKATAKAQAKAKRAAKKKAARAKAAAAGREQAEAIANATVIGTRYTTAGVNVRSGPSADADVVTTLAAGASVKATDNTHDSWRQVKIKGKDRWIKSSFLTKIKPAGSGSSAGISSAFCKHGSSVEKGLTANAIKVHRAVCAGFPSVTSYGGVRSGSGEHSQGHALDIMVTGKTGDEIAAWVRSNAKALGVSEVIWAQKIWTVQRSSEGWRQMSDRGSATANHYDHVHVTVN